MLIVLFITEAINNLHKKKKRRFVIISWWLPDLTSAIVGVEDRRTGSVV